MSSFTPNLPWGAQVHQSYVQGLKLHWKNAVYAQVAADAARQPAADAVALEQALRRDSPAYRLYGWLERHLQQFKYLGRHGMLPVMLGQQSTLTQALDAAALEQPQRLQLDAGLPLPDYYTKSDFHQHPGGVWSDDADAFVYEWAANAFSFSMQDADRPYTWLARYLAERFAPASVLDLGCGFGKLAIALKRQDSRMQVTGVDLAAPLLRLAHMRSLEAGLDIRWLQANAEAVPLPAASVDGVASYWLFHELPVPAMHQVMCEALRLLRPGGFFASFDMYTAPGGVAGECLHLGHAARNNEPYLPGLIATDPREAMQAAGFTEVELVQALTGAPAAHDGGALAATRTHTFTVVIGRKPA